MNISNPFRSKSVVALPPYSRSVISHSAKNFIDDLKEIRNTAEAKGSEISSLYKKTESCADKLAKSAEKGDLEGTMKYAKKLKEHSDSLFLATESRYTIGAIVAAKMERSDIASAISRYSP